ncbi:hypothetical protein O181_094580 [Austropuccinia psidii MF-1]|uniref:Uncharacterized protein n=1 Tax=Austropuccinia psidii MF-1 TaxID=1389203 RepID=A0A9Q3J2A8_9BASI|nr:hypothetical protein [Austropuccinia psidii MF-1]
MYSPGRILHQSLAIDFTSHRSSRKRQSSHENVTQSPNPFQHHLQCSGHFTPLACASPPNPPPHFACLRTRTALQMRLQHCPPTPSSPLLTLSHHRHYHLYAHLVPSQHASDTASHPYACVVPSRHCLPSLRLRSALPACSQHHLSLRLCSALPTSSRDCLPSLRSQSAFLTCYRHHLSLRLCSALPTCSRHCLPSLCLQSALPTCFRHHLSLRLCSALLTLPTILTLAEVPSQHAPNTTYPYACVVPSRHAPDTTYPYACVVPSRHAPNTAYHPYARGVPSQHAPDTTYPYACVVPSRHAPNTTYPYARGVPSQHAPDTTYPYASVLHP